MERSVRLRRVDQPACKPGSVGPASKLTDVAAIPLGRPLPAASSNQPGRRAWRAGLPSPRGKKRVAPIRFCSRWGLPCRPRCRVRGALLPHPFTLTSQRTSPCEAVCSLWHCPWGRPRRRLSGTASPWSPDFPPRLTTERPPGRLIRRTDCAPRGAGSRLRGEFRPPPASPANRPPRPPARRAVRRP